MTEECTCLDSNCCALCSTSSCDCDPQIHRLQDLSREKCRVHGGPRKTARIEDYGKVITVRIP